MASTTSHAFGHSLAALAPAACFAACGDHTPAGPYQRSAGTVPNTFLSSADAEAASVGRPPDLGVCEPDVQVPAGSKVSFHVFGKGVQVSAGAA